MKLVTSDAHTGLVAAIGATLPGACWQRCRTHYAANLMGVTPTRRLGPGGTCPSCGDPVTTAELTEMPMP